MGLKSILIDTGIWGPYVILIFSLPLPCSDRLSYAPAARQKSHCALAARRRSRCAMDVRGPLPRSHQGDVHQSSSSTSSKRCVPVVEGATGQSDTEGEGTGCGSIGTRGRRHLWWIRRCRGRRGRCVEGRLGGKGCRMGRSSMRTVPA